MPIERINLSEENKKEYKDWLEKLQYSIQDLDLSFVEIANKKAMTACFNSVEITLKALKEIVLK